ncbi:uncharacterized protein LOC142829039 [Pelodiscus sinensis]|uniref:uncharacterized protein LOC142829039 n=1 Tax=Pelodiscus sinensis TaxID=13735 RepID=UPI003F6BA124
MEQGGSKCPGNAPLTLILRDWKDISETAGLAKSKIKDLCQTQWPSLTANLSPDNDWPDCGTFSVERMNALRDILVNLKPEQMEYLFVWYNYKPKEFERALQAVCVEKSVKSPPPYAPETQTENDKYFPTAMPRRVSLRLLGEAGKAIVEEPRKIGMASPVQGEPPGNFITAFGKLPGTPEAYMAPLQAYPVPQNNGTFAIAYTHVPFMAANLLHWQRSTPRLRNNPEEVERTFRTIFSTHLPTWADVNQLLDTLLTEDKKQKVKEKARTYYETQNWENLPTAKPNWNPNVNVGKTRLAPKGKIEKCVVGVTGKPKRHFMTNDCMATLGPISVQHSFLLMDGPVNLLGKDLLCKLHAQIFCTPESISLRFPIEKAYLLTQLIGSNYNTLPLRVQNKVNPIVWGEKHNVGLVKSASPLNPVVKSNVPPPAQRQYPLKLEAIKGLEPLVQSLKNKGILVPCVSPCNTPILAVKKPQPGPDKNPVYRMVQDLRLINQYVIPEHPVVPNPNTILAMVPPEAKWFTCMDLTNAFFSIPVASEKQYLFAFTWGVPGTAGKRDKGSEPPGQLTWTKMPQGYVKAPGVFARVLAKNLKDVQLPAASTLVTYVNNILVASRTREDNERNCVYLLNQLALKGHKVSPTKLQWAQQEVKYLGYTLGPGIRSLDSKRIETIVKIPFPTTKRGIRGFIGMIGFCRPWIISAGELLKPLHKLTKEGAEEPLHPNSEQIRAFKALKESLVQAPALGLPNYSKPFDLYVHEVKGVASGVLTQSFGSSPKPVAYLSGQLDSVAKEHPGCLKNVAAAALLVEKAQKIVLGHSLTVHTPHAVASLLNSQQHKHLTNQRLSKYKVTLLITHGVTLKRCASLNPASLLPHEEGQEQVHDCLQALDQVSTPRPDLTDVPLSDPELELFVNESAFVRNEVRHSGYAVTDGRIVLIGKPLSPGTSAQSAKLQALTAACLYAKKKRVNIYTNSKYAFGVCHATGAIWKEKGFITSSGSQIAHGKEIAELLQAIQAPKKIAVIHCRAHTKQTDPVSVGNRFANGAAKAAALQETQLNLCSPLVAWQQQAPDTKKAI